MAGTERVEETNEVEFAQREIHIEDIYQIEPEQYMDPRLVQQAKLEELARFKKMQVYQVVPRSQMQQDEEATMVSIKWVVTNKGTEETPKAKARLVAREFNDGSQKNEMFAGTPGLQAMRMVISRAVTTSQTSRTSRRKTRNALRIMDINTAFL